MDWIYTHETLAIAAIGLLGGAAGYFFRARIEKKDNLREALYLLLEIWYRMTILSKDSFDQAFDAAIRRLVFRLPVQSVSEAQIHALKANFVPIIRRMLDTAALNDFDGLRAVYNQSIKLIAKSDPIYAYKLEAAASTKQLLVLVEQYFSDIKGLSHEDVIGQQMLESVRVHMDAKITKDATNEIEGSLRGLARRVSFLTFLGVRKLIKQRHMQLEDVNLDEFDELIAVVLAPVLKELSGKPVTC